MAKKSLSKTTFFQILARRCGLKETTIRKVYEQMFLLVAEELRFNGVFDLYDICKITTQVAGGKDKKIFDKGFVFVPEYLKIKIKPKDRLIDYVNGELISHSGKKKKRTGRRTKSDILLYSLSFEEREKNLQGMLDELEAMGDVKMTVNYAPKRREMNELRKQEALDKALKEIIGGE